jgi:hypothetical protein
MTDAPDPTLVPADTPAPEVKHRAPRKKAAPEAEPNSVSPELAPAAVDSPPVTLPTIPAPSTVATEVVGNGDTDLVKLSAMKFKNIYARKSLSVHHLQRRLNDLGYSEAYADKDGYYGDLTFEGVARYQRDNGLDVTGYMDPATMKAVFTGDPNVTIDLS